jgi:phage-related protein
MKPVTWIGNSRQAVKEFNPIARQRAGRQLARVQDGLEPEDWKPMPSVGIGVKEIRLRENGAYRIIYVAKFSEAIYVLHAFEKKTQKTPKPDIEIARIRFRALVNERKTK